MSKPVWTCDVCGVFGDFDLPKGNVRMRCSSPAGTCECLRRVWRFLICLRARCVRDLQVLWGLVNICGVFGDFYLLKGNLRITVRDV